MGGVATECPTVRATANVVARKGVGHHYTGYWVHTLEPWAEDTGMGNGPRSFLDLGGGRKKHEWV